MAQHLPRKKYLSKLLGDSPTTAATTDDKCDQQSTSSSESLVQNESHESLLSAIANSTTLGILKFDSAVFAVDSSGNRSTSELTSLSEATRDHTKCQVGPTSSMWTDPAEAGCDDDKISESSVYFVDGSLDDCECDDNDNDINDDDCGGMASRPDVPLLTTSEMMPSQSGDNPLTIPASASVSNLIDDNVLNNLLPSAESFASLLNCLELKAPSADHGNQSNTVLDAQQQPLDTSELDPGLLTATVISSAEEHLSQASAGTSVDPVCVKQEQVDSTYDHHSTGAEPLTTTSGRNRGRGKATEPKYDCQICGDVAAGYHCGAYVCEACKKFYLRCLKMGASPAFLCPKNNNCDITKDTRSHCQSCRFRKCHRLGMYRPGCDDDRKLKVDFKSICCKVCNAPSSGFHFGAITCEGCKGFFRRMLKEQLHKKFICANGESCEIASANRTNCKFCRFAKCLRVGMTLEGTRLGRQSNSVKLSTLMQYHCDSTSVKLSQSQSTRPSRLSESSIIDALHAGNGRCHGDDFDQSGEDVATLPIVTRSNSDAASHCGMWMDNRRRQSEMDDSTPEHVRRRSFVTCRTGVTDEQQVCSSADRGETGVNEVSTSVSTGEPAMDMDVNNHQVSPAGNQASPGNIIISPGNQNVSPGDHCQSRVDHYVSPASNQVLPGSGNHIISPGNHNVSPVDHHVSPAGNQVSPGNHNVSPGDRIVSPGSYQTMEANKPSASQIEVDDQLVFDNPVLMFTFLAETFRELDEIMNRPAELDAVKSSPASIETLWKLVEIPFMHHAKCVLRFIKKLPGFRRLPVEVQVKLAQDSVYPVTLIFHSQFYNLNTGEYNWFINTPQERDLVLGILPPFAALGSHFSSTGFALRSLSLTDVEMAFLAAMAVLTATDGSYVQSSSYDVSSLQDAYIDAFISYCQERGQVNRMSTLIVRLPELKRANIEHCLIAAQVQQMTTTQMEMGTLWRELFLSVGQTDHHC